MGETDAPQTGKETQQCIPDHFEFRVGSIEIRSDLRTKMIRAPAAERDASIRGQLTIGGDMIPIGKSQPAVVADFTDLAVVEGFGGHHHRLNRDQFAVVSLKRAGVTLGGQHNGSGAYLLTAGRNNRFVLPPSDG
jgi:hypothetical protein